MDGDYAQKRVVLPSYPFQRQRYWVDVPRRRATVANNGLAVSASEHPLLGHRLVLAGLSDVRFTTELSVLQQPYLADHRIYGQVIVPATVYLEMAISAAQQALKRSAVQLQSVAIQQPLMLSETQSQTIQVVLSPYSEADSSNLEKRYKFEIFSLNPV